MSGLEQALHGFTVKTRGPGFTEITRTVLDWLAERRARDGLLTVYISHTSASLTIQENADPAVQRDLTDALERIAPYEHDYAHDTEGPDDMPSHIKAMVTSTSLTIPVRAGKPVLGTWQGIYLIEHRAAARNRSITLHYAGTFEG